MESADQIRRAESLARTYKYHLQFIDSRVAYPLPMSRVRYETMYRSNRECFEKLLRIFDKYGVHADDFMSFSTRTLKIRKPSQLLDAKVFLVYAKEKTRRTSLRKIYSSYRGTVMRMAETCLGNGETAREHVAGIFSSNRVAYEYVAGVVSRYFLAAIPDFKTMYERLDGLNADELRIIYNAADELDAMLQEASFLCSGKRASPVADVETEIGKLRQKQKQNLILHKGEPTTCAHSAQTFQ